MDLEREFGPYSALQALGYEELLVGLELEYCEGVEVKRESEDLSEVDD